MKWVTALFAVNDWDPSSKLPLQSAHSPRGLVLSFVQTYNETSLTGFSQVENTDKSIEILAVYSAIVGSGGIVGSSLK